MSQPLTTTLAVHGIALALSLGTATAQTPGCTARVDSASTALDSAIVAAMTEHAVPGAALAIVRDGRVDRLVGYGCANRARDTRVDPRRSVFHIASVSKPFVALAAVQLAVDGRLDFHTDVNRYLRTMQVPTAWNRGVTLHDLLTHSAGFEESVVGYAARTSADIRPLGEFLAAKLPERGWPPGEVTAYSNYGYALAGYVVESVAGQSFADYVRSNILAPLGMRRSSFQQPMPPELERDAALSYRCAEGDCTPVTPDYRSAYPPGGLVTTADDMSRFMLAQLRVPLDGRQVLSDSVLSLMHTRQFTLDPALPGSTYGFSEDALAGERALTHAGSASGYTSFVVLVPSKQFGAFLVANGGSSRFGADARAAIAAQFLPVPAPAPSPALAPATVDPVGSYRLTRYAHRGVENLPALFNGQLHVRRSGDTLVVDGLGDANGPYVAVAANRWQRVGTHDLIAARAVDGRVTHLFGSLSFFGTRTPATYERLAWFDDPYIVNEALSFVVAVPIIALLAWPIVAGIVWLVRRRTRYVAKLRAKPSRMRGYAAALAVVFAAVAVAFVFGFIAKTNQAAQRGGGEIVYGLPTTMRLLAYAPVAIASLTLALLVATVVGWRRRWWSIPGLVLFTAITLNAVLLVALVVRWGYFPVATG